MRLSSWLVDALGAKWSVSEVGNSSLGSAIANELGVGPTPKWNRSLLVSSDDRWTFVFTDGPLGTDLGVLPSRVVRDLSARAIRATAVEAGGESPKGAVFEVFDPSGSADRQFCLRWVYAVDDGGWRFDQRGDPMFFEDLEAYARRRIADRLTPAAVRRYLTQLGAPAITLDSIVSGYVVGLTPLGSA